MPSSLALPVVMLGSVKHFGASLLNLAHGEVRDAVGCRQPFWAMVVEWLGGA